MQLVTCCLLPIVAAAAQGADIDVPREEDNRTPLHIAVNEGHAEAVEALLDAGAKVCRQEGGGLGSKGYESFIGARAPMKDTHRGAGQAVQRRSHSV
jgi:ankyrin repeat protein